MPCHAAAAFTLLGAQPQGNPLGWGMMFLGGWMVMTAAMMVPTILPFAGRLRQVARRRRDERTLFACLAAGYLFVWAVFGLVLLGISTLGNRILGPSLKLPFDRSTLAPALLAIAGLFQILPMKKHCLEKCRVLMQCSGGTWGSRGELRRSFTLGVRHGVACVGSCGVLMLLMFAVESAHLISMLVLTLVMAIEKNAPWGPRLTRPLGLLLLACAAMAFYLTGQGTA